MESRVGPDVTGVKSHIYPHNYLSQSVASINQIIRMPRGEKSGVLDGCEGKGGFVTPHTMHGLSVGGSSRHF